MIKFIKPWNTLWPMVEYINTDGEYIQILNKLRIIPTLTIKF